MKSKRPYVMRARADATAATRHRILRSALELSAEKMSMTIVLDDIAERAEVSVQTILRHFGTRQGLFDALGKFAEEEVREERRAPPGDVPEAVRVLYDHYEQRGDAVLRRLAEEHWDERVRRVNEQGRQQHRDWVEEVFQPQLAAHADQEELVDLLVVATDVFTWKLLRRDRKLSRDHAEARVRQLIKAVVGDPQDPNHGKPPDGG